MVGMASSVSLPLFMSYPIDRAKEGEITNILFSRCFPQSLLWQVGFDCTLFMFRSQSRRPLLFWGTNAYSIHWEIHWNSYNTPFYMFNNENIEFVLQMLVKNNATFWIFRRFPIKAVAYLSRSETSKTRFKTNVTLFLRTN